MTNDRMSRRAWLGAAMLAASAALPGFGPARAEGASTSNDGLKKSKKDVSYQDQPKGKEGMCANCKFFQPPTACLVVEGTISPAGWCQRFEKKSA